MKYAGVDVSRQLHVPGLLYAHFIKLLTFSVAVTTVPVSSHGSRRDLSVCAACCNLDYCSGYYGYHFSLETLVSPGFHFCVITVCVRLQRWNFG